MQNFKFPDAPSGAVASKPREVAATATTPATTAAAVASSARVEAAAKVAKSEPWTETASGKKHPFLDHAVSVLDHAVSAV